MAEMEYNTASIKKLEGLEAIRLRPGLYVELNDPLLLTRFVCEASCLAVDTLLDQAAAGIETHVQVRVGPGQCAIVRDNGPGFSMAPIKTGDGETTLLDQLLTALYACRDRKKHVLKETCCDLGVVVVNALSRRLTASNVHEGKKHVLHFERGKKVGLTQSAPTDHPSGLQIEFHLDESILPGSKFDIDVFRKWVAATGVRNDFVEVQVV
jgi:DNA gyrase/topoisomerase IV subunit B